MTLFYLLFHYGKDKHRLQASISVFQYFRDTRWLVCVYIIIVLLIRNQHMCYLQIAVEAGVVPIHFGNYVRVVTAAAVATVIWYFMHMLHAFSSINNPNVEIRILRLNSLLWFCSLLFICQLFISSSLGCCLNAV